jgi:hypothetical protein
MGRKGLSGFMGVRGSAARARSTKQHGAAEGTSDVPFLDFPRHLPVGALESEEKLVRAAAAKAARMKQGQEKHIWSKSPVRIEETPRDVLLNTEYDQLLQEHNQLVEVVNELVREVEKDGPRCGNAYSFLQRSGLITTDIPPPSPSSSTSGEGHTSPFLAIMPVDPVTDAHVNNTP